MNIRINHVVVLSLFSLLLGSNICAADEYTVNAEARIFNPDIIYVQPGDTVGWVNMTSHNTVSQEGLIPEGAEHWRSDLGENYKVTLNVEGVYSYVCEPHIGFGMVGVIVVGEPVNIDAEMEYAREKLQGPFRRQIGKLLKVQRTRDEKMANNK